MTGYSFSSSEEKKVYEMNLFQKCYTRNWRFNFSFWIEVTQSRYLNEYSVLFISLDNELSILNHWILSYVIYISLFGKIYHIFISSVNNIQFYFFYQEIYQEFWA